MKEDAATLSYEIRPFATLEEYEACAEFQEEIWGAGFSERVSAAILMVANKIGGLAAGAYGPEGRLLGFVFGLTGVQGGELVHWSDMLAVREGIRDLGLGRALKAYQREVLLGRGIRRMHWTFDPLQSRNAYVNFAHLGIVSNEYVQDMYGDTGSPLHGVGTDRLIATWFMDSERVKERMEGRGAAADPGGSPLPGRAALSATESSPFLRPGEPRLGLQEPRVHLPIPRDIDAIMVADQGLARAWRHATRAVFQDYMGRGYQVRELIPQGSVSQYILAREGEREG